MKILLALGIDATAAALAFALGGLGWAVEQDPTGEDAVGLAQDGECDAALINPNLPGAKGIVQRLRTAVPDLAIIVIGHAPTLVDLELMFGAGADDVLSHPVVPLEILLRARAIARRRNGHARDVIGFGALAVLPGSHAEVGGRRVGLSPSEFVVLERLALRAGRAVNRDALLSALARGADEPCAKVIDVFLCRIRKVLTAAGAPADLIQTVYGRGWMLPLPHEAAPPAPPLRVAAQRIWRHASRCAA